MIVLVLNSYLLFQNVYTTYKALKPPKPSRKAKNGVDPAVKAKHARKRELKGMLACWIVWSCWSSAEAVADRTIAVLTPFYSEIKMFLILFLIIGRSTMAEPILLHVIRPLVKPYYVSLDSLVDLFTAAADLAVLLFSSPLVWIRLVTRHAWNFLQKTFSSGSASLPRPGNHAVSASDADESLNEPNTPSESTDATKAKEQDPLQRFVPKTRGALAQPESDDEDVIYKNPLRDDPPPYGVPIDLPISRERSYPPVFSTPPRRAASRTRRMSIDHRTPFLPDTSMASSASYRPDSDVGTSFAFSPNNSLEITNGAGDLAPDRDVPAFSLATPEQPPAVVPAAPAVPSYLQPRTRASRANLRPPRQQPVDNYADQPNSRASEFLQGERGMTFADKPKEAKGLMPDASASYVSPPPSGYGVGSPPVMPTPMLPPQPAGYSNPYGRGRPGPPTRHYAPADDGYESPRGSGGNSGGNSNDFIQGWRQRSAIPVDVKAKRQQSGPGGYSYQPAPPSYVPSAVPSTPSVTSPSIAPSFPVPSVAPSLTPSQSISNVFPRPQPGYRPPPPADNRPPTAVSGRPPTVTPSHPPTSTTGMGLGLPRRQRSTRELRAQAWEPKEDNSAAEAERLAEEERRAIEQKEAERQAALERQRRKVSDSQQYQRTVRIEEQARRDGHGGKLRGRAVGVRTRDRVRGRALRGVGVERRVGGKEVEAEKDKIIAEKGREEAGAVDDDGGDERVEESPRKRRRVGEDGESVEVIGPESSLARRLIPTRPEATRATAKLPSKRAIDEVAPEAKPRVSSRMALKPPTHRTRPLASKIDRPRAFQGPARPTTTTRPSGSRLPRATGRDSKPAVSKSPASGSRNVTNN